MTSSSLEIELQKHLRQLYTLHRKGIRLGLETTFELCAAVGNPERNLKCIHIAGTNGKGSVAATLAQILLESGLRVGLYTSPHLIEFSERIQINGQPIETATLLPLVKRLYPIMEKVMETRADLTFFEATTALAFMAFAEAQVDVVILETGLGGRLDSTNVIDPLCSVITTISRDHEVMLGNTLPLIAGEKAGIIKPQRPVFAYDAVPDVWKVFEDRAAKLNTSLERVPAGVGKPAREKWMQDIEIRGEIYSTHLLGEHQWQNLALAVRCAEFLAEQGYPVTKASMQQGTRATRWPGRFQVIRESPLFVLDGAHNEDGLQNALATWRNQTGHKPERIVFGVMRDKQLESMVAQLEENTGEVWLLPVRSPKGMTPEQLLPYFKKLTPRVCTSVADVVSEVQAGNKTTLLAGSLYLVGETLAFLAGKPHQLDLNG